MALLLPLLPPAMTLPFPPLSAIYETDHSTSHGLDGISLKTMSLREWIVESFTCCKEFTPS